MSSNRRALLSFQDEESFDCDNKKIANDEYSFTIKRSSHSKRQTKKLKRQIRQDKANQTTNLSKEDPKIIQHDEYNQETNLDDPIGINVGHINEDINDKKQDNEQRKISIKVRNQRRFIRETMEEVDQYMRHTNDTTLSSSSGIDDDEFDKMDQNEKSMDYSEQFSKVNFNNRKYNEDDDKDDEDEDIKEWENQQILKGVNNFKYLSSADSLSQTNEDKINEASESFSDYKLISLSTVKQKLNNHLGRLYKDFEVANHNLKRINDELKVLDLNEDESKKMSSENNDRNIEENAKEKIYLYFQELRSIIVSSDDYIESCKVNLMRLKSIWVKTSNILAKKNQEKIKILIQPNKLLNLGSVNNFLLEYQKLNSLHSYSDVEEINYIKQELTKNQQIDLKKILLCFINWKKEYPKIYLKCFAGPCLAPIILRYAEIEFLSDSSKHFALDNSNWYSLIMKFCNYPLEESEVSAKIEQMDSEIIPYVIIEMIKNNFECLFEVNFFDMLDTRSLSKYSNFFKFIMEIFKNSNRYEDLSEIINNKICKNISNSYTIIIEILKKKLFEEATDDSYIKIINDICLNILKNTLSISRHFEGDCQDEIISNLIQNIITTFSEPKNINRHLNYMEKTLKILTSSSHQIQCKESIRTINAYLHNMFKETTSILDMKRRNINIIEKMQNILKNYTSE